MSNIDPPNRLIHETSPYLLQHAHNPVDWYPWGDEAFARARAEDRPVLLSVGYATCHWCHVMERESFEDPEIAAVLNAHFVAVKVDREERPDVDGVYMQAVQLLAGQGGWPMTLVLTPERVPFFAGTYFPARDGDRGARFGFLSLLHRLAHLYRHERQRVIEAAASISRDLGARARPQRAAGVPPAGVVVDAVRALSQRFDERWGGFDGAPKFPRPALLDLLLRDGRGDETALGMASRTLERMAEGGVHDQVGHGFHRYSTDERWLVPHFEKMLYDNAQLAATYLDAAVATGREDFAAVARTTLDYLAREMTAPGGGFFSATDADSAAPEGEMIEGYFYTWTPDEVARVVGDRHAALAAGRWGIDAAGQLDGRSVPYLARPLASVAREVGMSAADATQAMESARVELYAARAKRPAPLCDDKVVTGWNGLAISAFARGALLLDEEAYRRRAMEAATFVLGNLCRDGALLRSFRLGRARHAAVLDDYAFVIQGLLDLFEADSDPRWLREALALQSRQDEEFWAEVDGGYFATSRRAEILLLREMPDYDGAEPSGNSVAALNLVRLALLIDHDSFWTRLEALLAAFDARLRHAEVPLPKMLVALYAYHHRPRQVLLVRPDNGSDASLLAEVRAMPASRRVLVRARESELATLGDLVPWLQGKRVLAARATAYVCDEGRCQQPTSDATELRRQLRA